MPVSIFLAWLVLVLMLLASLLVASRAQLVLDLVLDLVLLVVLLVASLAWLVLDLVVLAAFSEDSLAASAATEVHLDPSVEVLRDLLAVMLLDPSAAVLRDPSVAVLRDLSVVAQVLAVVSLFISQFTTSLTNIRIDYGSDSGSSY